MQPLPDDRKCFRLINGVLVERTVKDVLPALRTNSDGLKQVLEELLKQYKGKEDEMNKWKVIDEDGLTQPMPQLTNRCRRNIISRWFRINSIVIALSMSVNDYEEMSKTGVLMGHPAQVSAAKGPGSGLGMGF